MNGVVHVGGHKGEEVPEYLSQNRSPIVLFEPQDLNWTPPKGVMLVNSALGEFSGKTQLRVPHHLHDTPERDTQSSSGLVLIDEMARKIGWTPTKYDIIEVDIIRFDRWADSNGFESELFDLLSVDVQGMELQVLKGFGSYINGFKDIIIECSEVPIYEGGAPAQEVVDFLSEMGYSRQSPILPHGDIKFTKRI
jgi:FkbM family methyltransferase